MNAARKLLLFWANKLVAPQFSMLEVSVGDTGGSNPTQFSLTLTNSSFLVPGQKPFGVSIDWGDGNTDTLSNSFASPQTYSHNYSTPGHYTITPTLTPHSGPAVVLTPATLDVSPSIPAPTGFVATPLYSNLSHSGFIEFDWSYPADPDSFVIERSAESGGSWSLVANVAGTERSWNSSPSSFINFAEFWWRVSAVIGADTSLPSNVYRTLVAPSVSTQVSAGPTTVDVTSTAAGGSIAWQTSTDGTTWSANALTSASGTLTGLTPVLTYLNVQQTVGGWPSWWSDAVTVTPTLAAPVLDSVVGYSTTQVTVTFHEPANGGAVTFKVYIDGVDSGTVASGDHVGPGDDASHSYTIRAENGIYESVDSNAVSMGVLPLPPTGVSTGVTANAIDVDFTPSSSTLASSYESAASGLSTQTGSSSPIVMTGASASTPYTGTIKTVDSFGQRSAGAPWSGTTDSNVSVSNPSLVDTGGSPGMVEFGTGSSSGGPVAASGGTGTYSGTCTIDPGDGSSPQAVTFSGANPSFSWNYGLTTGNGTYTYVVFVTDSHGNTGGNSGTVTVSNL